MMPMTTPTPNDDPPRALAPGTAMMICDVRWFSVAGLVLDIIGAVMLFRYGLPEEISRSGAQALILEEEDSAANPLARRYDRLGRVGLGLLIVGFALQLIGSWPWTPR